MRSNSRGLVTLAVLVLAASACADGVTGPTASKTPGNTNRDAPTSTPPSAMNAAIDLPQLTGGGFLTDYFVNAPFEQLHEFASSVLASTGPMVLFDGKCCRVLGDTILQLNWQGAPEVGTLDLGETSIELPDDPYAFGQSRALLMIRDSDFRMRFYVPAHATSLEILAYTPPVGTAIGSIRGHISFEAAGYVQVRTRTGSVVTVTPIEGTTHVSAAFVSPMRYKRSDFNLPR
jgi:hypothetical protein